MTMDIAGDRPPRCGMQGRLRFHRRARACPSPCVGWGNGVGLRAFFARVERSRGTGPRATVDEVGPRDFGRKDILVPIRTSSRPGGLSYGKNGTAHNERRYGNILSTRGKNFTLRNCETPVTTQVLKLARKLQCYISET